MVAPIGLWPKPDQLHDIPRAILASVKAQIAALLPGEMEVVRVPAEDMRWLLWESKQLRTIGGDPRDAEIARLKAEVERLRADHECAIETLTVGGVALDIHSTLSMTTHVKSIVSQVRDLLRENQALRLDLAAHKRALAAGPAALRKHSLVGQRLHRIVEAAQAAAMKEKP